MNVVSPEDVCTAAPLFPLMELVCNHYVELRIIGVKL
jgi:hypothetical protein